MELHAGGECGVPTHKRFQMPGDPDKYWYSFDAGPVHFLQYNTELDFAPGSEQHKCAPADASMLLSEPASMCWTPARVHAVTCSASRAACCMTIHKMDLAHQSASCWRHALLQEAAEMGSRLLQPVKHICSSLPLVVRLWAAC